MSDKLPILTPEQSEADYGEHFIWRLVNSTIVEFGGNDKGEIFLSVRSPAGKMYEFIVGQDPDFEGGVALFEVERKTVVVTAPEFAPIDVVAPLAREDNPGNWVEDFVHGNDAGIYENACLDCGKHFLGFKRRMGCKVCDNRRRGIVS